MADANCVLSEPPCPISRSASRGKFLGGYPLKAILDKLLHESVVSVPKREKVHKNREQLALKTAHETTTRPITYFEVVCAMWHMGRMYFNVALIASFVSSKLASSHDT